MSQTQSSSFESKSIAPDTDLLALAGEINSKTRAGRVNFFVVQEGEAASYAIIFQDGPKRATVRLRHRPSAADLDDIVQGLETWAGYKGDSSLYSTDVPPLPMSEWAGLLV